MPKYNVLVPEIFMRSYTVTAESPQEASIKAVEGDYSDVGDATYLQDLWEILPMSIADSKIVVKEIE